tara:strand:+ start:302 stop:535 length:234 start_codon:yes stop_codon:yes gene_type:complete
VLIPKPYTKFELVHHNDHEDDSDDSNIIMDVDNYDDDDEDFFSENSLNVRLSMNTIGKLEPNQEDDAPKLLKVVSWY